MTTQIPSAYPLELEVTVVVPASGEASVDIPHFSDTVAYYSVIAPSDIATYAIEVTETTAESRTYGHSGQTGNTGNTTIKDEFEAQDGMTVTISSATPGTYYVKFWRKRQLRPWA